jgi:hypothetical protein
MELVVAFILILAIFRLVSDDTRRLFLITFTFTGGAQFLIVLMFPGVDVSDGMGFTNSLRRSSSFPSEIQYGLLTKTVISWAFLYYMLYLTFKFSFVNKTPLNMIWRTLALTGNFHYLRAALFLSVVYLAVNYAGGFFSGYLAPPISLAAMAFLLVGFVSYQSNKKQVLSSPCFLITLLFLILPALVDFSRGQILMPFIGIMILVYFLAVKNNLNIRILLIWCLVGVGIVFITTMFKLYLGAVANEYDEFLLYTQGSFDDKGDYFSTMINSFLARLNGSQTLYWYFFDMHYGPQVFASDRTDSLFFLFNSFVPGVFSVGNEIRQVSGMPVEQWLFWNFTGLNASGGFALPPFVEFIWATRSVLLGFFVTTIIFILFSCFFRLLVTHTRFGAPCLVVLCFYIFLKSESIAIMALYSIKYFPASILVCFATYRVLKLFKLFIIPTYLKKVEQQIA